ncbi:DUF423 domain-containing protein [Bordetella bronchialis]|uniref:DUF423 domain-containing protein n=1 Tax=Bordetella bronchialis TaxID=463025 RepID=A0A193FW23_9BORD|nr:DUF423 domain-containing protein [Bordetella bronchialis]ANN66886.1 hypothetical protein BAU06_11830 [Bordetella bronchialis]ANN71962.1 hypothetical protein BAU08_12020 [Bordetella bronchialis]
MIDRVFVFLGALNMFLAVGAGAFGAHGLRRILTPEMLQVWQTAVTYHIAHALGLLAIAALSPRYASGLWTTAGWLMFAGIILFSGSLYLLSGTGIRWLGAITPLGGTAFLAGWALVAWAAVRAMPPG